MIAHLKLMMINLKLKEIILLDLYDLFFMTISSIIVILILLVFLGWVIINNSVLPKKFIFWAVLIPFAIIVLLICGIKYFNYTPPPATTWYKKSMDNSNYQVFKGNRHYCLIYDTYESITIESCIKSR